MKLYFLSRTHVCMEIRVCACMYFHFRSFTQYFHTVEECSGCYSQVNTFLYSQNGAHKSLQQTGGG